MVVRKKWQMPWLSLEQALREIDTVPAVLSGSDARSKRKLARRLSFAGICVSRHCDTASADELEKSVAAINLAKKSGGRIDGSTRAQALISKRLLEIKGCTDVVVLAEKKKSVFVEAAYLAAAPGASPPSHWCEPGKALLPCINSGELFLITTGADGRYPVTLRLIDAAEPVLMPDEYSKMEDCSEVGYIRADGGELRFGAPESLDVAACIQVPPGLLLVQAYRMRSRYLLVACPTDKPPLPLNEVPEVQAF